MKSFKNNHAIVLGGSLAGLLTARVLSDYFQLVTIIEKDQVNDQSEARKGQPQTRHVHALLAKGLQTMTHYFPTLVEDLKQHGALIADLGEVMRWFDHGGYRKQFKSGFIGALMSRPLLEWQIRRHVLALPNVILLDQTDVEGFETTPDHSRITGVKIINRRDGNLLDTLSGDLIVDAAGRGSQTPKWLESLGYARPTETTIKVNMGYATRTYRRKPSDLVGAGVVLSYSEAPQGKRMGLVFPSEGERWIVTLGGIHGDHAPLDEKGFLEFARNLPTADVYDIISKAEPLSDLVQHKFPASLRRHYEKLERFPQGLLVIGDAVGSFNPIYGQGMTSAALQVAELDQTLSEARKRGTLDGIAKPYFKRAARVVEMPWQLAAGADFVYPETEGEKAPGTDFINNYVAKVHRATHSDEVVYGAFLKVMNLIEPPQSLFNPKIVWRVLSAERKAKRKQTKMPQTVLKKQPGMM